MKTAKVLGIVGGVIGLLLGLVVAGMTTIAGEAAGALGAGGEHVGLKAGLVSLLAIVLPVVAIVGAVKAEKTPKQALWLLVVPAIVFVLLGIVGGGAGGFGLALPGLLMGAAAFFLWRDMTPTQA
jgi:hypothetical protein